MNKFLALFCTFFIFNLDANILTLESCIEKSLQNHPDIKKLSLGVHKSSHAIDIAKSDYMPQINLHAEYNPHNTFVMPQNGTFGTIHDDSWQVGGQINQKIYDFSKTTSTIDAYKKEEQIANLSLKDAKAYLAYNITNIYNQALFYTKALEIREKDLETKEALYRQAVALVKEGLKTEADEMSMLSALYSAEDAKAQSRAELHKALVTLSLYMAEEVAFDVTLRDDFVEQTEDIQSIKEDIFVTNYALSSAQEQIKKDTLIHKATQAQNYGSIDAFAAYTHQSTINKYDTSMVGIGIKIPLYSGGRISAQSQISRIDIEMAKESYSVKKLQLQEEIDRLLIDLERFHYTTKAKEALINSTSATKTIVEARYKEGLSTYIEVLDASSLYLQATLGVLESKFAIRKIMDRLEYLKGEKK